MFDTICVCLFTIETHVTPACVIELFYFLFQAYLREGVALQNLGQHGEALAAFGAGLAQDANNTNLITGLIDAALKSPLKGIPNRTPVFATSSLDVAYWNA